MKPEVRSRVPAERRLTITLSAERHQALKETAAARGKTLRALIEESLDRAGVKTGDEVLALIERARRRSRLSDSEAMRIAICETRAVRRRR